MQGRRIKIAVVGAGLSGLQAAAQLTSLGHEVSLFEQNPHTGGHIQTVRVPFIAEGAQHEAIVDMGVFMFDPVLIHPYLYSLIKTNNIAMSQVPLNFTLENYKQAHIDLCWTTSGCEEKQLMTLRILGHSLRRLFKNHGLVRGLSKVAPFFQGAWEFERFNRMRELIVTSHEFSNLSIRDFMDKYSFSDLLLENLIIPQMLCWWGSPRHTVLDNSIQVFTDSLYKVSQLPQYTITRGMDQLVGILEHTIKDNIHTSMPVRAITRNSGRIIIHTDSQDINFDALILATPPSVAIKLLSKADAAEIAILNNYQTTTTTVYLHSDTSWMPQQELWAIINSIQDGRGHICSFWVGKLHPLAPNLFLSWGDQLTTQPDPKKTIKVSNFLRTLPTLSYVHSSHALKKIQGRNRTWYCGAHVAALGEAAHTPNSLWADNALKSGINAAHALQHWLKDGEPL